MGRASPSINRETAQYVPLQLMRVKGFWGSGPSSLCFVWQGGGKGVRKSKQAAAAGLTVTIRKLFVNRVVNILDLFLTRKRTGSTSIVTRFGSAVWGGRGRRNPVHSSIFLRVDLRVCCRINVLPSPYRVWMRQSRARNPASRGSGRVRSAVSLQCLGGGRRSGRCSMHQMDEVYGSCNQETIETTVQRDRARLSGA